MAGEHPGWIYLSRELAADLLELADAEIDGVRQELGALGRRAVRAVLLGVAAVCLAFWIIALIAYTLVAVASLWLPLWGAGLAVTGLFILLAALLGWMAVAQVKKLDNPIDVVVRRLREHLAWWRREVRLRPEPSSEGPRPAPAPAGAPVPTGERRGAR